jgi:hypothetical protein
VGREGLKLKGSNEISGKMPNNKNKHGQNKSPLVPRYALFYQLLKKLDNNNLSR